MKRGDAVSMRAVLAQFLADEATAGRYANALRDFAQWSELPDDIFYRKVREFEKSRSDVNPVLTFTLGTRANLHHERVLGWRAETVALAELYTCGLNSSMKNDLDAVQGNLVEFAKQRARKYGEFRLHETPSIERQRVIVARHSTVGRQGSLQLLDGAHRVVALAAQGVLAVKGFVAEMKP